MIKKKKIEENLRLLITWNVDSYRALLIFIYDIHIEIKYFIGRFLCFIDIMKCNYAREKFVRIYIDIYTRYFARYVQLRFYKLRASAIPKEKGVLGENELEMNRATSRKAIRTLLRIDFDADLINVRLKLSPCARSIKRA